MLTTHEIDQYLLHTPSEHTDIIRELRSLISKHAPEVSEIIRGNSLCYYYPAQGGPVSAGVAFIDLRNDHIRFGFIHGAFLPDPKNLLMGEAQYKKHVILTSYDAAPWEDLEALIVASAKFDPHTLTFSRNG